MASDGQRPPRDTTRTIIALLAIAGFVLIAAALPSVGGPAAGTEERASESDTATTGGSDDGALQRLLDGRAAAEGGAAGGSEGFVGGLLGAMGQDGSGAGSARDTGERDTAGRTQSGGLGALNAGRSTGVGSASGPLSESLRSQSDTPHFTVRSSEPSYWRTGAYRHYTGSGWDAEGVRTDPEWPRLPSTAPRERRTVTQTYTLLRSASALPAAWEPTDVDDAIADDVLRTAEGGLVKPDGLAANSTYSVTSAAPPRDPARLRRAGGDYPIELRRAYTDLPASTPDRLAAFTDRLTADSDGAYETAAAIEQWLEATKNYSLNASHESGPVADRFVFEMDRGYCEYFATAMTVMLRTQSVPSRYVVGYSTGQPQGNGTYLVRAMNAHAWVEVYFPDTGWVRFDPTPGQSRLRQEAQSVQRAQSGGERGGSSEGSATTGDRSGSESGSGAAGTPGTGDQRGDSGGESAARSNTTDRAEYDHTESGSPGEQFAAGENASLRIEVQGDPIPGRHVPVRITRDGEPAAGVTLRVNGDVVGLTNESGYLSIRVPFADQLVVSASDAGPGRDVLESVGGAGLGPQAGGAVVPLLAGPRVPASRAAVGQNTTRTFDVPTAAEIEVRGPTDPGASVVVRALVAGSRLPDATVSVDGRAVGRTNDTGALAVDLPASERTTIAVDRGAVHGNRTLALANLSVTTSGFALPGLSITASVTDDGDPVADAAVDVGDATVRTGPNGEATVQLPFALRATVVAETPAGVTASRTVGMQFLEAGLGLLALFGLGAGTVVLRGRAVSAGRTLGEQVLVTLSVLSGAFVGALVGLAATVDRVVTAAPSAVRRLLDAVRALLAVIQIAITERSVDRERLPSAATVRAWLLAVLRQVVAAARTASPIGQRPRGDGPDDAEPETSSNRERTPRERIEAAWRAYRTRLPDTDYRTKTPGELARRGVDAGLPTEPVRTLRDALRAVEYGRGDPRAYLDDVDEAVQQLPSSERAQPTNEATGAEAQDRSAAPDGGDSP